MASIKTALIFFLLLASSILSDVNAKTHKSSRSHHSYPSSHGLSGHSGSHSSHSYPSTSGLSGHTASVSKHSYPTSSGRLSGSSSNSPSYPTSVGLSGSSSFSAGKPSYPASSGLSGSHSYPASNSLSGSGSKVSYPASSGLSGSGTNYGSSSYPSGYPIGTGSKVSYPSSPGLSGSGTTHTGSSYPASNGLSGNRPSGTNHYIHPTARPSYQQNNYYPTSHTVHHHTNTHTVHHHHYVYHPPSVIHYSYGGGTYTYPVYTGHQLPSYVYEYRSSGNKYSKLLAGLALFNLGMAAANPALHHYHKHYTPQPGEVCKFGVQYNYGSYDEMAIDCRVITSYIWEEQSKPQTVTQVVNQTVVTTNVQTQTLLPNGSLLVPANGNVVSMNSAQTLTSSGVVVPNTVNSVNTVTTTQVYTVTDPKYKGKSVEVTPGMECYVTRTTMMSKMRKDVPCELLNTYAVHSLRKSFAVNVQSSICLVISAIALVMFG